MLSKLNLNNKKRLLLLLAPLMLLLSGCQTAPSSTSVCPAIVEYSKKYQKAAAVEIKADKPGPHVTRFLLDYSGLRDQLRKCQ